MTESCSACEKMPFTLMEMPPDNHAVMIVRAHHALLASLRADIQMYRTDLDACEEERDSLRELVKEALDNPIDLAHFCQWRDKASSALQRGGSKP
jgi:hypothetical protein